MSNFKYYIEYTTEEPKHPKEIHGELAWETGVKYSLIEGYHIAFDKDTTFNEWREEEMKKYYNFKKTHEEEGRIEKLNIITNPSEKDIKATENKKSFIKWCET